MGGWVGGVGVWWEEGGSLSWLGAREGSWTGAPPQTTHPLSPLPWRPPPPQFGADFHDLSRLADLGVSLTSGASEQLQAALEELAVPER